MTQKIYNDHTFSLPGKIPDPQWNSIDDSQWTRIKDAAGLPLQIMSLSG
jgi:hypothetical protein